MTHSHIDRVFYSTTLSNDGSFYLNAQVAGKDLNIP